MARLKDDEPDITHQERYEACFVVSCTWYLCAAGLNLQLLTGRRRKKTRRAVLNIILRRLFYLDLTLVLICAIIVHYHCR